MAREEVVTIKETNMAGHPADPVTPPGAVFMDVSVCVERDVSIRFMTWRPQRPVSEAPIIFVAGWLSAVSGWAPLLKVMASGRPVYYIETREKRSARIEKKDLQPEDFSIGRIAADLISVSRQLEIAVSNTTVIGSSLGATALLEALKGGELTAGAAFLIAPNSDFPAPWHIRWMLTLPAFLYHGLKHIVLWYVRNFMVDVKNEPEQMQRYTETLQAAHPQRIKLSAQAAIDGRYEVWPHLETVRIPVALAYAPTDKLHSATNIRLIAARLPRAEIIVCPSNRYMHRPELMADIEAFMRMTYYSQCSHQGPFYRDSMMGQRIIRGPAEDDGLTKDDKSS